MSKNKLMQERSIEELIEKYNFFVPEIQREYVWGHNERNILDNFCKDLISSTQNNKQDEALEKKIADLAKAQRFDEIRALLEQKNGNQTMNIGFLYSYAPNYRMEYFPESDYNKDVYLIDGQQRFTTLFITLFYLSIKESKKKEFIQLFRYDQILNTVAFDYRVRNITHNFFVDLIGNTNTIDELLSVEKSTWFLRDYKNDPTVRAILNAIIIIERNFRNQENEFYTFVSKEIKFWHFKTDKTNQGEELYITMNSRGKQLEDNETVRAKLFESIDNNDKLQQSDNWEKWQYFFWMNRNKKKEPTNADDGFNEFLKCIAAFESFKKETKDFIKISDAIYPDRILKYLNLENIQKRFKLLEFLFNHKNRFKEKYRYSKWVDDAIGYLQELYFEDNTNWFIDFSDDRRANERRKMVFVWSILEYMDNIQDLKKQSDDIFRVLRIYWLRYNNNDRSVVTINARIQQLLSHGIWSSGINNDEIAKHQFLRNIQDQEELRKFESAIWELEDHPLNINGYQVKGINITHLIHFDEDISVQKIQESTAKFNALFPPKQSGNKTLSSALLYFGFYAIRRSPYYYENWDFSSWRRIIRDLDSEKKAFSKLFKQFNGNNLKQILERKQNQFLLKHEKNIFLTDEKEDFKIDTLIDCLRLYDILAEDLWKHGRHIAVHHHYIPSIPLTEFETSAIYNTQGNFRGYRHEDLYRLVKGGKKTILKKLREKIDGIKQSH